MTIHLTTYTELLKQREELERRITMARNEEVGSALLQAWKLIEEFGLTSADVFPSAKPRGDRQRGSKGAPRYRDPMSGRTWTGYGRQPEWIKGQDLAMFEIEKKAP